MQSRNEDHKNCPDRDIKSELTEVTARPMQLYTQIYVHTVATVSVKYSGADLQPDKEL